MRENIIRILTDTLYKPMDEKELIAAAKIDKEQMGEFLRQLDLLEKEGYIYKTKKKRYVLPEKVGLIAGKLSRNRKGFGFVIPIKDDGKGDIFVPAADMMGAMNGDIVMVSISSDEIKAGGAGSREGEIKKILSRATYKFAGIFNAHRNYGFVSDTGTGEDFFVSEDNSGGAQSGDRVVIKVLKWPERGQNAEARVTEILGKSGDTKALLQALVFQHGLRQEFPEKVLAEAERIDTEISRKEIQGRRDLREKVIVTIDGASAKDLDDAVSVEKRDNGNYLLGVHIADVTHYVKAGSKIDAEAYKRGTSVYYIDQVIPMLPEKLSNGVCSLNPHIPRLTLSCEMEINPHGEVVAHSIFESVIQTTERLVYSDISDIIENDDKVQKKRYAHILPEINLMNELATILRKNRMAKGSIDFDLDEPFIEVDEQGNVLSIGVAERRIANRIIEEFMIKTNETVSEHFFWIELPFMYRIHEKPDEEKIIALKDFLWNLGYSLKGSPDRIHPKALNDIILQAEGQAHEHLVNTVILKAMNKAKYSEHPEGHFGLGLKYYSHFTSPIRRYPDLLIHRIIKEYIGGAWDKKRGDYYRTFVPEAANNCSACELEAEKMERDAEKLKMAEYMSSHCGEIYDGVISGVLSSGFFVEIENMIEGFIRVSTLIDDYYVLDKNTFRFMGEHTRKQYALGDKVKIIVVEADVEKREINFEIVRDQKASVKGRLKAAVFKEEHRKQSGGRGDRPLQSSKQSIGRHKTNKKNKDSAAGSEKNEYERNDKKKKTKNGAKNNGRAAFKKISGKSRRKPKQ